MKQLYTNITLRTVTVLMLLSLPFIGSNCEDIINQLTPPPTGDLTGTWVLIYNAGGTHDICPGELVEFPNASGGSATLSCPNQTPVSRIYTVSGTTLTYTETSTTYEIGFTQNNELVLDGSGSNGRILYYTTVPTGTNTDARQNTPTGKTSFINSSEIK